MPRRWSTPVPEQQMVTITIDGGEVEVPKGASLLHACLDNGAAVPYFCDHRKLDPIGACRMCVVQIEGQPKLATACTITTTEGMKVRTESPDVIEAREGVLEFLLINHPLDCPVCDGCAVGCNTQVQTRDDRVVRLMSRDNPAVDDGWLCDRGRYGFHFVNDDRRVLEPRIGRRGEARPVTYAEAVAAVAQRLQEA